MLKTNALMSDEFPKLKNSVNESIQSLSNSLKNNSYQDYIRNVELYFERVTSNVQQHLQQSEIRTSSQLTNVHNKLTEQSITNKKLGDEKIGRAHV